MTAPPILLSRASERERASFALSVKQQKVFGVFLFLHGLAHAGIGLWAGETGQWWLPTSLWELAMVGLLAAGLGALGVSGFRNWWRQLTVIGSVASLLLLILTPGVVLVSGLTIDFVVLSVVAYSRSADAELPAPARHPILRMTGIVIGWLFVIYVASVLAMRPWNLQWGSTSAERAMTLPGDEFVPVAHYRIDHAITIDAPPEAVWPWLIQIGQDRGGFYSYTKLENAVGARITNANTIVPEWQTRRVGELVPTVPENYLRGTFGRLGCKVLKIVPGEALVLEGWGAFVVLPTSDNRTRMIVRTRGEGLPTLAGVVTAPFGLLVFEPAHLIMERGMLLGIKKRAEHSRLESTFLAS